MKNLFWESFIFGLLTLITGTIVSFIISPILKPKLPIECKHWNKNHMMELSLFLTGFLVYYEFHFLRKKIV